MDSSTHRLIYLSRNDIDGSTEEIHQEVFRILEVARERNSAAGITGALMFNSGCFAQVLEGSQEAIEETFERIQSDTRHADVIVLSFEPVESTAFDTWSMAYVGSNTEALAEFDDLRTASGFDAENIPGGKIFAILQQHLLDAEGDLPPISAAA